MASIQMHSHLKEALHKTARYCAYQERSHKEVFQKLRELKLNDDEANEIITLLIQDDYLNEERYAELYCRSKFNQKHWGKIKIKSELRTKGVSQRNIDLALKTISNTDYYNKISFLLLKKHDLEANKEKDKFKLKKKVIDYALRRGFESGLVFSSYSDLFE